MRILVMGIDSIDETKFRPCDESEITLNKPPFGTCLYGSTMITQSGGCVTSDWGMFTQFDYTEKYYKNGISFTLKRNAKIIEIDTLDDYRKVLQKYTYADKSIIQNNQIDFYKLSQDYDAFHLTKYAIYKMRLPWRRDDSCDFFYKEHNANFYSYDVETWILFNLDCINKGSILNYNNIICSEYN